MNSAPVNPEAISAGDIISTTYGLAKVGWIDNEKGSLAFRPLNEPTNVNYHEGVPIRSVRLVSKQADKGQLTLPFIQEMIEEAIRERDREIIEAKKEQETFIAKKIAKQNSGQGRKPRSTPKMTDQEVLKSIEELSPSELKELLSRLS